MVYILFVIGIIKLLFNDLIIKFIIGSNEVVDLIIDLWLLCILIVLMVGVMLVVFGVLL